MNPNNNQTYSPWRGIIPPMVTPLSSRDTLDVDGLERLIEHMLAGGVHGLFILGTTGEAPGLSYQLRRELIERTMRQVAGRVPVLAAVTDTAFVESVSLAYSAADHGVSALVTSTPYYFPLGQAGLLEYIKDLAAEMPLPLFLYNMPTHTKVVFEPETIRRTMAIPSVVGLKDSSASMGYFRQIVRLLEDRPDWTLLIGPEELLAELVLLGGHGGVCCGANLCPHLYVNLYEAAVRRDLEHVTALHRQVMAISTMIYTVGQHRSTFLKGLKCALSCLGICDDVLAEPFRRFGPEERAVIESRLADLGIAADTPWPPGAARRRSRCRQRRNC